MGEVRAIGDQAPVPLAGEQRDAAGSRVMAEEVAGHAHLPAAAAYQHLRIEPGPALNGLLARGLKGGGGNRHHDNFRRRTSVLARVAGFSGSSLGLAQRQNSHLLTAFIRHDKSSLLNLPGIATEHQEDEGLGVATD
jgi:hypothetical protein